MIDEILSRIKNCRELVCEIKYSLKKMELRKLRDDYWRGVKTVYDGVSNESYIDRYFEVADSLPYKSTNDGARFTVLDVGCSVGIAAFGLKELLKIKGYKMHVIGVDPQRRNFTAFEHLDADWTKRYILSSGLDEKIQGVAQSMPVSAGSVDLVIFKNADYGDHFGKKGFDETLKEITRVLKPDGHAYISEWECSRWKIPYEIDGKLVEIEGQLVSRDKLMEYVSVL